MLPPLPFLFAIPFGAKNAYPNWQKANEFLEITLRSIFQQRDSQFNVVIACHDTPEIDKSLLSDPRLALLHCQLPVPHNKQDVLLDKGFKKLMMGHHFYNLLRQGVGGLLMFMDADDFVHRDLVSTCKESVATGEAPHGYIINKGYFLEDGRLRKHNKFNAACGSSGVIYFNRGDLPATEPVSVKDIDADTSYFNQFKAIKTWGETAGNANRPLAECPLRAVVYRRHSWSMSEQYFHMPLKTRILNKLRHFKDGVPLTPDIRATFGIL